MIILPISVANLPNSPRNLYVHRLNKTIPSGRITDTWDVFIELIDQIKITSKDYNGKLYSVMTLRDGLTDEQVDELFNQFFTVCENSTNRLYDMWMSVLPTPALFYRGEGANTAESYLKVHLRSQFLKDNIGLRRGDTLQGIYTCPVNNRLHVDQFVVCSIPVSDLELTVSLVNKPDERMTLPIWCFFKSESL